MKNVLFWCQVLIICGVLLFCGVGIAAVDEWLVHDWQSIAPQKISLLAGLAGGLGVLGIVWMFAKAAEPMFQDMRNCDPDCPYDDLDGEYAFFDSPTKPR